MWQCILAPGQALPGSEVAGQRRCFSFAPSGVGSIGLLVMEVPQAQSTEQKGHEEHVWPRILCPLPPLMAMEQN